MLQDVQCLTEAICCMRKTTSNYYEAEWEDDATYSSSLPQAIKSFERMSSRILVMGQKGTRTFRAEEQSIDEERSIGKDRASTQMT